MDIDYYDIQLGNSPGRLDSGRFGSIFYLSIFRYKYRAAIYKRYFSHDYAFEVVIRKSLMYSVYRYPCKVSAF